jgi:hypothetical protein
MPWYPAYQGFGEVAGYPYQVPRGRPRCYAIRWLLMRVWILLLSLTVTACASPTKPSVPSPTPDPPIPEARLVFEGELDGVLQADGRYAFPGNGRNVGDGCAASIGGSMEFSDATPTVIARAMIAVAPNVLVRPGATFTYTACCVTSSEAYAARSYVVRFTFQSVRCP